MIFHDFKIFNDIVCVCPIFVNNVEIFTKGKKYKIIEIDDYKQCCIRSNCGDEIWYEPGAVDARFRKYDAGFAYDHAMGVI